MHSEKDVILAVLVCSLSSLHTSTRNLITRWLWNCPSTPHWEFRLTPLKDSIIARYSESDPIFLLLSYIPPINNCLSLNDSINTDRTYTISCCANLVFWLVHRSLYPAYDANLCQLLWLPVGWTEKTLREKTPTSYCNNLTFYIFYAYLLPRIWDHQR